MPSTAPHRVRRRRFGLREWAGRITLACGMSVIGYQSVAFTVGQVEGYSQPQMSDAMTFYDGRLIAAHAAALISPTITPAELSQAKALSIAALRRDPTAVSAAATLGFVTLARDDTVDARRLLAYAQKLSRRNVQTQLWSIEDAVARGDIGIALRWYDITLRTNPEMSEALYPVLARASHGPTIRAALARTLAGKPTWSDTFITYLAAQKDDPQSAVALFEDLGVRGASIPAAAQSSIVNVLLNSGNIDEAWRYYSAIRPGVVRVRSRDPRFGAMLDGPSPFDWMTLSSDSIAASIQRTHDGGLFQFSAPASIGGGVLQQLQLLPAGLYRLTGHSAGIAQDAHALPYWTLTCRGDGRELGRVAVPNSIQARGMFAGMLTVPVNCPAQTLMLFAQASDAIGGTSGQIDRVLLAPAR